MNKKWAWRNGDMTLTGWNWSTLRKTCSLPHFPPQIPHKLTWNRIHEPAWDLWWIKLYWDRFLSNFSYPLTCHLFIYLFIIYFTCNQYSFSRYIYTNHSKIFCITYFHIVLKCGVNISCKVSTMSWGRTAHRSKESSCAAVIFLELYFSLFPTRYTILFRLHTVSAIFFPLHVSGLTDPSSGGLN